MKPSPNRTILYYNLYCDFQFFSILDPPNPRRLFVTGFAKRILYYSWTPKRILYYSCSAEKISVLLMSAIKDSLLLMSAKEGYWIKEIRKLGF